MSIFRDIDRELVKCNYRIEAYELFLDALIEKGDSPSSPERLEAEKTLQENRIMRVRLCNMFEELMTANLSVGMWVLYE